MEIWKDIQNNEGYSISNFGNVKSSWKFGGYIMKACISNSGYLYIKLNGKHYYIHRLVALYFIENPKPKDYTLVDHIDRNKTNNHVSNLRWSNKRNNALNAKIRTDNKSGIPGIFYRQDRPHHPWMVSIKGDNKHSKSFATKEEAIQYQSQHNNFT